MAEGWITDAAEIYRRSFQIIREETDLSRFPSEMTDIAIRVIHACGMTEIAPDLAWSEGAAQAGREALRAGAPIIVDAEMVGRGIIASRLSAGNQIVCTLLEVAPEPGTTRSAMAVYLWRPHLEGAIVVVGNAPTALFRLLSMIEESGIRPALIVGFPVGFVGAAESKEALAASGLPFITLKGRKGGSAMAAAVVNALSIPCDGGPSP